MDFSAGGLSAVEFIVRTDQSTKALVFPLLCARATTSLCPVAPFCLLLVHA
jgi:hypothetical protein